MVSFENIFWNIFIVIVYTTAESLRVVWFVIKKSYVFQFSKF